MSDSVLGEGAGYQAAKLSTTSLSALEKHLHVGKNRS